MALPKIGCESDQASSVTRAKRFGDPVVECANGSNSSAPLRYSRWFRSLAHAQDDACKFAEWGYSYYRVEQQGEAWTYLLTASGHNWLNKPYGYHAPGFLVCERCASPGNAWAGVYDFYARADLRPATAAERAQRRKEWIGGYPNTQLGPEHIEHFGSREGVTLGPLTGYASLTALWRKQAETRSPKSLPHATRDFW
jgi:hypothetical protein